jgi:cell fate regulator YaaT (PSP1 superfamily)
MSCTNCSTSGGCAGCGSRGRQGTGLCPSRMAHDWLFYRNRHEQQADVVEVIFKGGRKAFFRNPEQLDLITGDAVLVEADKGIDFGHIHLMGDMVAKRMKAKEILPDHAEFANILNLATLADIEQVENLEAEESKAYPIAQKIVAESDLEMELVDVEWQFDKSKVIIYFTADKRVDFRQLVRDLASQLHARIEMRQIGARDASARLGGLGACGRELCCASWLTEFKPVNNIAPKVQSLPLNPTRLSGLCGRLKCCLNYELEQYMDALADFPKLDTYVRTEYGNGRISKIDIFKQVVWVEYPDHSLDMMELAQIKQLIASKNERNRETEKEG